ncbi:hypothetical protein [Microbacterium sp. SLBN-146]|uniref:hypothetical protein n=1 Tax=Microbacterium sp. SLBN-146 TaxID=2768457 RepID=UPI00114D82F6|nr:hypothetical protein [Microbacterium sp. SLBN-146]TQJ32621.1 hypothetical protein FBY39_3135 [Microbacterium sp. SLBN-146]
MAEQFRQTIFGTLPSGQEVQLGPLAGVLLSTDGRWRDDYLARMRDLLRLVLRTAVWSRDLTFYKNTDVRDVAREVGRRWGVEEFPAQHTGADGRRVLRWADALAADESVLAILGTWLSSAEADGVGSAVTAPDPTWPLERPKDWPPTATGERARLVESALRSLGTHPLLPSGERGMLEVLRRRVAELHMTYLSDDPRANTRFFHLRHRIIRTWFHQDLLDLHGAPVPVAAESEPTGSAGIVARSEAAISAMLFHDTVLNWNQEAIAEIIEDRYAWRIALGGYDPLEQLVRRRHHRLAAKSPTLLTAPRSVLDDPAYLDGVSVAGRAVFVAAREFRRSKSQSDLSRFLTLRGSHDWRGSNPHEQRVLLLADQIVHLASIGVASKANLEVLDGFLEQSAAIRPEYGAYVFRDRALDAGKKGDLDDALQHAASGMKVLEESRSTGLFSVNRAQAETEHQLALAIAGSLARILEKTIVEHPGVASRPGSTARIAHWARAADAWSTHTLDVLQLMESEGWLQDETFAHLADRRWRAQTRIIRHRVLCAIFTLAAIEGVAGSGAQFRSELRLDEESLLDAYRDMARVQEISGTQPLLVTQLALWHAFLMSNEIPFEADEMSVRLRRYDYLTSADASTSTIDFDLERRMLAVGRLIDADWDSGVLERIPAQSAAWIALDLCSHGTYSAWRRSTRALRRAAREDAPD